MIIYKYGKASPFVIKILAKKIHIYIYIYIYIKDTVTLKFFGYRRKRVKMMRAHPPPGTWMMQETNVYSYNRPVTTVKKLYIESYVSDVIKDSI